MGLKHVLGLAMSLTLAISMSAQASETPAAPIMPQVEIMAWTPLIDVGLAQSLKSNKVQHGQAIAAIPVLHSLTGVLKNDIVRKGSADEDHIPAGQYVFGIPMHTNDGGDVITWCAPRKGPGDQVATVCFPNLGGTNYWVPIGDKLISTVLLFNATMPQATAVNVDRKSASLGNPMALIYEFDGWVIETLNGQRHLAANISVKLSVNGHQTLVGQIIEFGDAGGGFHIPIQNGIATLILVSKTGNQISLPFGLQTADQFARFYAGIDPERAGMVAVAPSSTGNELMIRSRPIRVNSTGDIQFDPPAANSAMIGTIRPPPPVDMAMFYPDRAQRLNVSGKTTIRCTVGPARANGSVWRFYDCLIVDETPTGFGFGMATLKLFNIIRIDPNSVQGGLEFGQAITKIINWNAPVDAAPPPTANSNGAQLSH